MRKKFLNLIFVLIVVICTPVYMGAQNANECVYLGGFVMGFDVKLRGANVLALSDVVTDNGIYSPSRDAGIICGDVIESVNGVDITCAFDITKSLKDYKEGKVVVKIKRGEQQMIKEVEPKKDVSGRYKLGVFVKDGVEGIGTMTFIKNDGSFMALGHPICDEKGCSCNVSGGSVYACSVYDVEKGRRGRAGELKGLVVSSDLLGNVSGNLSQGIKGNLKKDYDYKKLKSVELGEGAVGSAELVACVEGTEPKNYSISIVKVDLNEKNNKNYVIKVEDQRLLELTGGIVQGMSGSPILQNGKLIGAVTHVFINDSARGFGISVQNMMNAMNE